jgi:hypothetical protein
MAIMLAHAALALSLVVRIYDAYGVPDDELAAARAVVERILRTADVAVAWARCPCQNAVGGAELVIRISASVPASEPASLGFSYVDVDRKAGTLATVFADRVRMLASSAGVNDGELLGRAMAHEVVHLLLGTRDHDRDGLMRGEWTRIDLARNRPWDWALPRHECTTLRQAIVRRTREPARPAAVMAGAATEEAGVSLP